VIADAQVMRGASYWSDHYMVRAKLHFRFQKAVSRRTSRKRTLAVHHLFSESVREKYQGVLAEKFNVVNDSEESTESYRSVMKTSLLSATEEVVGYGGRVQPDWFKECSEILIPLIDEKNTCRERLLQNDVPSVRREFHKC